MIAASPAREVRWTMRASRERFLRRQRLVAWRATAAKSRSTNGKGIWGKAEPKIRVDRLSFLAAC